MAPTHWDCDRPSHPRRHCILERNGLLQACCQDDGDGEIIRSGQLLLAKLL